MIRATKRRRLFLEAGCCALLCGLSWGCASHEPPHSTSLSKAVRFLSEEVPAWSVENRCFSCHNNGDAARALVAAERAGYPLPPGTLEDTLAWLSRPGQWDKNRGDPGFSDRRLANLQFAAALAAALDSGHLRDSAPLQLAADKILADQAADGAWPVEPGNAVGSPATYGSVLATFMAMAVLDRASAPPAAAAQAAQWLNARTPNNVPTAASVLLAHKLRPADIQASDPVSFLREAQGSSGGWGPYADSPPEVYDTALAVIALARLEPTPEITAMIQRGRTYLEESQLPDGSWPPTTRPPGGDSYAQQISTAGWATLALLATQN